LRSGLRRETSDGLILVGGGYLHAKPAAQAVQYDLVFGHVPTIAQGARATASTDREAPLGERDRDRCLFPVGDGGLVRRRSAQVIGRDVWTH
jgi:hypothetical protein